MDTDRASGCKIIALVPKMYEAYTASKHGAYSSCWCRHQWTQN